MNIYVSCIVPHTLPPVYWFQGRRKKNYEIYRKLTPCQKAYICIIRINVVLTSYCLAPFRQQSTFCRATSREIPVTQFRFCVTRLLRMLLLLVSTVKRGKHEDLHLRLHICIRRHFWSLGSLVNKMFAIWSIDFTLTLLALPEMLYKLMGEVRCSDCYKALPYFPQYHRYRTALN
jgi:hypothetical protein